MYPEVDPVLGPEMRSTGEVLGMADSFGMAFFKAQEAARPALPREGAVLISAADKTDQLVDVAKGFVELHFDILATSGTHRFLSDHGIESKKVNKMQEGRPNIVDAVMNEEIQLVINTPISRRSQTDDSYIRKAAVKYKVPYITTMAAAIASVKGIAASRGEGGGVRSLQSYHEDIVRDQVG
jgi:carbamoyl-phosphate synthase large subunit